MRLTTVDVCSAVLLAALIGGLMSACGGETALTPAAPSDLSTATTGSDAPGGELNPAFRALAASDFEVIRLGWR